MEPEVSFRFHKRSTILITLFPLYLYEIHFISLLSSHLRLGFPSILFHLSFSATTSCTCPFSAVRATCSASLIFIVLIALIIFAWKHQSRTFPDFFLSSCCSLPLTPKYSSRRLVSYLNNVNLCFSLNVKDQVSCPCEIDCKPLLFIFI
jgi:hypothetical protein